MHSNEVTSTSVACKISNFMQTLLAETLLFATETLTLPGERAQSRYQGLCTQLDRLT